MVGRFMRSRFLCLPLLVTVFSSFSISFAATDLCKQYAVDKDYDRAIEECTKQIRGEIPVRYLEYSYSNRGAAYANKKEYDKAISDYAKAIELNPGYATAYYNRAIAYSNKEEYDEAISDFNKVLDLNPKDSSAYVGRATAFANKKDFDQAILDYTMAIELNPDDSAAYHNRAMVFARKKEFARAVADRDKAVELSTSASSAAASGSEPSINKAHRTVYHVQLGIFKNKNNASALTKRFRKKGYDAFMIKSEKDKMTRYRVLVGRSEDRRGSEKLAAKIKKKEKLTPTIYSE